MDTRTRNVLSICSGVGGLELGLGSVIPTRTVCYVENELSVASILAARMEDGSLDSAPIWTDLKSFSPEEWRGRIHLISGGPPCQPFSNAGSQKGSADSRNLFPEVLRIAHGLGLPDLFLENVSGGTILKYYWGTIRPQLREMGYQVAEGLFTASETGAPHRRERLFILAHASEFRNRGRDRGLEFGQVPVNRFAADQTQGSGSELAHSEGRGEQDGPKCREGCGENAAAGDEGAGDGGNQEPEYRGNELADTDGSEAGRQIRHDSPVWPSEGQTSEPRPDQRGGELADTDNEGLQGWDECGDSARERVAGTSSPELGELPLFPPGPNDHAGWQWLLARWPELAPTYCREGHDVQPEVPATESEFRGASHGTPTGVDRRLKGIGNGVVPIVSATAYLQLTKQLEGREE